MKIVTKLEILDPSTGTPIARISYRNRVWKGELGAWSKISLPSHPSEPDPLRAHAEALKEAGAIVSITEGDPPSETDEGLPRVY